MALRPRNASGLMGIIAALALAVLVAGCGQAPAPGERAPDTGAEQVPASAADRARAAAADFSGRLRAALRDHMGSEGPVSAVAFCREQAPAIAAEVMTAHGVRLGRVALPGRERNPGNTATGWQVAVLARFADAVATGGAPEDQVELVIDGLPDGIDARLARGIRVEAPCQLCHGVELAPGIAEAIALQYPGDRATGFREGDLRGALWVEVPATEPPP
ncbi:MAG: DUF3365 domain-containing protein [Xanthomonadales bacterium]|nr:DUF3365 domain-containing protein [Xanthomonadales bacterium]